MNAQITKSKDSVEYNVTFGDITVRQVITKYGKTLEYMQDKGDYFDIIDAFSDEAEEAFRQFFNWKVENGLV